MTAEIVKPYVCIGWGSLLWNPGSLARRGGWHREGPELPVEFARISDDGRLTLVVWPQALRIRTYWVELNVTSLESARESLAVREGCGVEQIGSWTPRASSALVQPVAIEQVDAWARPRSLAGVVWTDLPSRFQDRVGKEWSPETALEYLRSITRDDVKARCEEYVRRAPEQTQTRTRSLAEKELGWSPRSEGY